MKADGVSLTKEWLWDCEICAHRQVSSRRPRTGGFHWTPNGRCFATPRVMFRWVSGWLPEDAS